MSAFQELFASAPAEPERTPTAPIRAPSQRKTAASAATVAVAASTEATISGPVRGSIHNDQIHSLVRQLFFRRESPPVRHVAFAPVEASTETANLCLDVARVLAEEGKYDVGRLVRAPHRRSRCRLLP